MSKSSENLAIVALLSENPKIKKVLESHGHKIGENYIAPKNIASLALLNSMAKKGVDFDLVISTFREAFDAKSAITRKVGKDQEEIVYVNDHKTRMDAVKTFTKLMGISNGISTDNLLLEEMNTDNNISISFKEEQVKEVEPKEERTDLGF